MSNSKDNYESQILSFCISLHALFRVKIREPSHQLLWSPAVQANNTMLNLKKQGRSQSLSFEFQCRSKETIKGEKLAELVLVCTNAFQKQVPG